MLHRLRKPLLMVQRTAVTGMGNAGRPIQIQKLFPNFFTLPVRAAFKGRNGLMGHSGKFTRVKQLHQGTLAVKNIDHAVAANVNGRRLCKQAVAVA